MTPVVFLHGAGEDARLWSDVVALVAPPARVHELPAHGRCPGPPLRDVEAMAAHVLGATTGASVFVGHSLGGAVALQCALDAPERVAGLVLVATGAVIPVSPRFFELLPGDFEQAVALLVSASTGGRGGRPGRGKERVAQHMATMVHANGPQVLLADLAACARFDVRPRLRAHVRAPWTAEILAGELDKAAPVPLSRELAELIDAQVHVIAGGSHQLPVEAPESVADACVRVRGRTQGEVQPRGEATGGGTSSAGS